MELADQYGAQLVVFSVHEHLPRHAPGVGEVVEEGAIREEHLALLRDQALALLGEMGPRVQMETEIGHAAQAIIREVTEAKIDLVVIGRSGHSALWGTLLGSTTARVVDQAHCDVLVVR
jgi:nucleotide-binding universal stress UspA family protein